MATKDLKTYGKNNQKKATRATVARVDVPKIGTLASGDVALLASLPAHSVVTNAYYTVVTAPTGGTQTLKLTVGGTDVIAAVATGTTAGAVKGGAVTKKYTSTGADLTATVGVADLTDGVFDLVVEYTELERTVQEYTN